MTTRIDDALRLARESGDEVAQTLAGEVERLREECAAARINTIGECIAAACGAESLTEAIEAIADLNGKGGEHG